MSKIPDNHKYNTVFSLLVRPILALLLFMMGIFGILMHQNVLSYLKTNAVEVFERQVSGRKLIISNEMVDRWSNIHDSVNEIVESLEEIVEREGADISDIHTDAALNRRILDGLMDDIIGTLRACGSTEIFLILDGNAVESDEKNDVKAGVYLRNSNPDFYSSDNQDLLLERGVPSISESWQLSLDSYWSAGFDLSDETDEDDYFYLKPFQAASASDNKDFRNFAYWGYGHPVDDLDRGILSYSVPLITSDGDVAGVVGIGVSEEYFNRFMDFREFKKGVNGAYFLGKTIDGIHFKPVIFNGSAYNKNSFLSHTVEISGGENAPMSSLRLEDRQEGDLCASVQYLQLYNNNTPFEEERWALVGLQPEGQLLSVYNSAQLMLVILILAGTGIGVAGIFWTSRLVSRPLRRLMEDLRKSNTHRTIHLKRLHVEEIDELVSAIESLSARVAASSSKISTIIQMAESGIGVYEYLKKDELVFCSRSLYEILRWSPVLDTHEYIDSTLFRQRMKELEDKRVPGERSLYDLSVTGGGEKWIRLNRVEDEEGIIGVITDVTAAVLEKRQIEYERDYDILTNIYNLRAFQERLKALSAQPEGTLKNGALVMWDLDNLKFVNDVYGHHMGDAYIIALADCLRKHQSQQVLSARRSGDEFYTLLFGFEERDGVKEVLGKLWEETQESEITLPDGRPYRIRVSAGISWYPEHSKDFSKLLQYADFAMYSVKHSRKGAIASFDPEVYHEDWFLTQGQEDFNTMLDSRLVRYAAQPILDVKDGGLYGYEMLMRSEMPSFQSPADILRMAHAQSRLYDIEVMSWFEALRAFKRLTENGAVEKGSRIFINSISSQILKEDMLELLEKDFASFLPSVVCEFTEEEQGGAQITRDKRSLMRRWKAQIALDDYGCGYNGESVLLALHPDIVKIDMGIVRGIQMDENRKRLVKNLVLYGHERNILILGEGVETRQELKALIDLGVDLAQGYYIAKPTFEGTPPSDEVRQEAVAYYKARRQREEGAEK